MHTLISPREVIEIAFAGSEPLDRNCIDETIIITAEQKFIRPVLGDLYDALLDGRYQELLCGYIKAPLALYVKLLVLPSLAVQTGSIGVVQQHNNGFISASDSQQAALNSQVRMGAITLIRRAVSYIEANPTEYPEYIGSRNILNKISIDGHIIL